MSSYSCYIVPPARLQRKDHTLPIRSIELAKCGEAAQSLHPLGRYVVAVTLVEVE
jgi:hypothetical protein